MIRHYSFFRPHFLQSALQGERVWNLSGGKKKKKSNTSWPGSVAVNSEKKQTRARSGNITQSNVWTEKRRCVMERHKFRPPKGVLIDSVLHYEISQGAMDSSFYYENVAAAI